MAGLLVLLAALLFGTLPALAGDKGNGPPQTPPGQAKDKQSKKQDPAQDRAGATPAQPAAEPPPAPQEQSKAERKEAKAERKQAAKTRMVTPVAAPESQPAVVPVAPVAALSASPRRAGPKAARPRLKAKRRPPRPAPPRRMPLAPERWVPASASAPVAPVAAPAPARAADRPERKPPRKPVRDDSGGVLQVVPLAFNALSESVAFVPAVVWGVIGGLALLALALLGVALARHHRVRALGREREALLANLEALEGAVLPALPEALGGLALSVSSSPTAGPATGGDFHDAFPLSQDRVAVLVGDVAGSGGKALADAQLVRHAVRAYLEAGLDPRAAIAMTGAVVDERDEPLFASVIVAVHDRSSGVLTFASAGHEPPVLVGEQGAKLPPVSGWSPPLGTGLDTGRRQTAIPLRPGTAVCLITDGVTEARSEGERIGVSRVIKWLSALGPGAMSSDVMARLQTEADAEDDVTICMLRALTPADPDAPRVEEAIVEAGDQTYLVRFLRDCGLPLADAEEAGAALAAMPDGTRMVASVEIRGGRGIVELAPLRGATAELIV